MKTLRWIGRFITAIAVLLVGGWLYTSLDFLLALYFAYPTEILLGTLALILFISGFCFLEIILDRGIQLKEVFEVFKPVAKLTPDDFHITNYNNFYIERESDKEIETLLGERKYVFISGIPMLGKTRMAYGAVKKLKGFYLLKPKYERIDVQKLKLPLFKKKIALFLDDLDKYLEKFNPDDLIRKLKEKSQDFVVVVTCRSGKEFEAIRACKEMEILLTECQKNKIEPRLLEKKEEQGLADVFNKNLNDIISDGTPGSITIDLRYMTQRYEALQEQRSVLKCLKLLRAGNIFQWSENLVKEVNKEVFGFNTERTKWDNVVRCLSKNGFIKESSSRIAISHDVYLDDRFLDDYCVRDQDLKSLKEVLFHKLSDAENLFYLGNEFHYKKNLSEAEDCYRKSIKIKPNFAETHNNLGVVLKDLERYEEAEEEYKEALRINPHDDAPHLNLGVLFAKMERNEEAEKEYKKAILIYPKGAMAHNNLGNLISKLERYEEAEEEYRKALRINPEHSLAHNNLGKLLYDLKRYAEAEKELKDAKRVKPNLAEAYFSLGKVLIALGRKDEAKGEFEIARDLFRKQGREEAVKETEGFLDDL